jgi:hypothetical protein
MKSKNVVYLWIDLFVFQPTIIRQKIKKIFPNNDAVVKYDHLDK